MIAIAFKRIYILYLYIDKYMTRYSIHQNYLYHQSKLTSKRCPIKFKLSVFMIYYHPPQPLLWMDLNYQGFSIQKTHFLFIALKLFSLYFARNMITWQMQSI